jgi:hypothetical protein
LFIYRSVKDYLIWMKYLSFIGYGNELVLVTQWDGVTDIACTNKTSTCPVGQYLTGQNILDKFEMIKEDVNLDIGILFAMYFLFRIITYLILLLRVRRFK